MEVIIVLTSAGTLYLWGWWRLRRRTRVRIVRNQWRSGALWRPISYLGGLFVLALALMSPIDVLASQLFTMHMIQHVLLVMIIPPLLLLANPLPYSLWGLPGSARRKVGSLLRREATFRQMLGKGTGPGIAWLIFVIVYWGWHDPGAYNLALQNGLVHDLEHITFLLASLIFWWHVLGAGPRIHKRMSPLARGGYVLLAVPPSMLAGIAIAFSTAPIYTYYEFMPRLWGLSLMDDQRVAGIIMWVPGSMMFMLAALVLVGRWLQRESDKPALPQSEWATDEALLAPGLENSPGSSIRRNW